MNDHNESKLKPLYQPFSLGPWVVEPSLNRIWDETNPKVTRYLEPRIMRLLCLLGASQGRALSREQLTDALWPRVIVNENSLTRAISELRKKLNHENDSAFVFVETIPKTGYRLIPGLITNYNAQISKKPIAAPQRIQRSKMTSFWQPALSITSLVVAVALTSSQFTMSVGNSIPDRNSMITDLHVDPIADQVLNENDPFSESGANLTNTLVIDEINPFVDSQLPLVTPPLVSTDGKTLAYVIYENNYSTLYLSNRDSVESPIAVYRSESRLYNLSWSPVGDALLFASQPVAVATTLLQTNKKTADLMMLDLTTLEISVLIDSNPEPDDRTGEFELT